MYLIDINEIGFEDVNCIRLAQDRDRGLVLNGHGNEHSGSIKG
jgi:hypothetical protein